MYTGTLPKPTGSFLATLKRIHPGLFVVPSDYPLDYAGRTHYKLGWRPRYYLWIHNQGKDSLLFAIETPEGKFQGLDQRVIRRLQTDISRATQDTRKIEKLLEEMDREDEEARVTAGHTRTEEFIKANMRKVREARENAGFGRMDAPTPARDKKLFSYEGQINRGTAKDKTIPLSDKELGWEVPD